MTMAETTVYIFYDFGVTSMVKIGHMAAVTTIDEYFNEVINGEYFNEVING